MHDRASLAHLVGKYDAVNIKLDKAGGLTEALALAAAAEGLGFMLMVGCMISTSLSIAPALLVAQRARVVDLDGPLLLARDRPRRPPFRGKHGASGDPRNCGADRRASGAAAPADLHPPRSSECLPDARWAGSGSIKPAPSP